jgi:hypothetical protein
MNMILNRQGTKVAKKSGYSRNEILGVLGVSAVVSFVRGF